eukprot:CAMPEP_0114500498 /NCGR_PEP_ID=MMETSP0109-20121206/7998_1 /TAXON_ID=29199 /ORGANISM="Chlorarachnion reptans, Strain CCCM449" /LENGTH=928 /DNA_ID=CAMNT_0001678167 /DNA_START=64 /DNA_END=2850 /DNA_ORIENTATION=-
MSREKADSYSALKGDERDGEEKRPGATTTSAIPLRDLLLSCLIGALARAKEMLTIIHWLPRYPWKLQAPSDVVAGLTVGVMAVPQAMSYALVAGMPGTIYGLYNALMGLLPYPFFGSSPHLITGPTAVMSILVKSSIPSHLNSVGSVESGTHDWVTVAVTLSFMAGFLQLLMGILRLGSLVELVSEPVIIGFTSGSAFLIASTQFGNFFGVPKCSSTPCHFHEEVRNVFEHTRDFQGATILMGTLSLCFLLLMKFPAKRWLKGTCLSMLPSFAPLILMIASILFLRYSNPSGSWGIKTVGSICDEALGTSCLPTPSFPLKGWFFRDLVALIPAAVSISLIGYMESMTVAKTCARQRQQQKRAKRQREERSGEGKHNLEVAEDTKRISINGREGEGFGEANGRNNICDINIKKEEHALEMEIDPSQELIALGMCNFFCSCFQGYPVTGSFSRTAVNAASGASSPLASLVAGGVVASALVLATSVLKLTPKVTLASIVLSAITNLIEPGEILLLWRVCRNDFWACAVVFLCTLFLGVEAALAIGIVCNWAISLSHSNHATAAIIGRPKRVVPGSNSPERVVDVGAGEWKGETYDRSIILRLFSDLTFSSAPRFARQIDGMIKAYGPLTVVVDCTNVNAIDITGVQTLIRVSADLNENGTVICLSSLSTHVIKTLKHAQHAIPELCQGDGRWVLDYEEFERPDDCVRNGNETRSVDGGTDNKRRQHGTGTRTGKLPDGEVGLRVFPNSDAAIQFAHARMLNSRAASVSNTQSHAHHDAEGRLPIKVDGKRSGSKEIGHEHGRTRTGFTREKSVPSRDSWNEDNDPGSIRQVGQNFSLDVDGSFAGLHNSSSFQSQGASLPGVVVVAADPAYVNTRRRHQHKKEVPHVDKATPSPRRQIVAFSDDASESALENENFSMGKSDADNKVKILKL